MNSLNLRYPFKKKPVNGYGCYKIFQAVKLHFTPGSGFNVAKYGKIPVKRQTYDRKGGQTRIYERLALNHDSHELYKMFVTAAVYGKLGSWLGQTVDNGGRQFISRCDMIVDNPEEYFGQSAVKAAYHCIEHDLNMTQFLDSNPISPVIYWTMSGEVSPYILAVWDCLFDLDRRMDVDDVSVDGIRNTLSCTRDLLQIDRQAFANVIKNVWIENNLI